MERSNGTAARILSHPLAVRRVLIRVRLTGLLEALHITGSLGRAAALTWKVSRFRKKYFSDSQPRKVARIGRRDYLTLEIPGYPGPAFRRMLRSEYARLNGHGADAPSLRIAFVGITRRCPLACAHCYDWKNRSLEDTLTVGQLLEITGRLERLGVSQIFLSGGEPLARFDAIVDILAASEGCVDYWLLTSGVGLTSERAKTLKAAGLTGVCVSLDHHRPEEHDRFRGHPGAFVWVERSAQSAGAAGLAVAVSLCATRPYVSEENLWAYARAARQLGASFIQVLEPRAVGRFADGDVALTAEQIRILESFYATLMFDRRYLDWPIVTYYGYRQRRMGCTGAGDRYVYVDARGRLHACPFCQSDVGSFLEGGDRLLACVRARGCEAFAAAEI